MDVGEEDVVVGVVVTVVAVVLAAGVVVVLALGFCGLCVLFLRTFYFLLRDPYREIQLCVAEPSEAR